MSLRHPNNWYKNKYKLNSKFPKWCNEKCSSWVFPVWSISTQWPSVAFHRETNHISIANQMTGSCMKCNTRPKWLKDCAKRKSNSTIMVAIKYKSFLLTHFNPMLHFYTPWKRQKTKDLKWANFRQVFVHGRCPCLCLCR